MLRILALALVAAALVDLDLTPEDVDRGLALGRRAEADTAAFHRPYVHEIERTVDGVTVRQVEVLTPYRRLVQFAEQRRRFGDVVVSRADAEAILKPWRTRVVVVTTVRFHPQNRLTSIPPIEAAVRDAVLEANVPALEETRHAITNARTMRPILGATIETVFDAGLVANLKADVVVTLHGKELARTSFDFRALD